MAKGTDDPPQRKTVTLPTSMWYDIAAYRQEERISTEAEAIRRLLQDALRAERRKSAKPV